MPRFPETDPAMRESDAGGPIARTVFRALLALGALAYAGVVWQQLRYGLEFDESYNLTVVRNVAEGHGYSSNSAVFPGVNGKAFDPFVSTGPTLLLPASLIWHLTDGTIWAVRMVPLLAFLGYLTAAWLVGRRLSGRLGGLCAAVAPLALATAVPDLTTRSLVPGRVIGEFGATGFLLFGIWALLARRPLAGGVLLGLAVQTKANFAVAAVIVLATWVVGSAWPNRPMDRRATALAALGAVLPTAAFEAYRFGSLGADGYLPSVAEFVQFLRSQSHGPVTERLQRVEDLVHSLSWWGWLLTATVSILAVVSAASRRRATRLPEARAATRLAFMMVAAPAAALLGSWLLVSTQSSVRQGLPFLLMVLPLVGAGVPLGRTVQMNHTTSGPPIRGGALNVLLQATVLLLGVSVAALGVWRDPFGAQLAHEQRDAAQAIVASGTPSLPVALWWQQPEMQVLTGLHPEGTGSSPTAGVLVYTSVQALIERKKADARVYQGDCGSVLYASAAAVVCRPR